MESSAPDVPSTFDAQDAVQDAVVRAYRSFDRFRGGDGRAWLLTIVRNVCFSRLRQGRRDAETQVFDDDTHGATADPGEARAVVWRDVRAEWLRQALKRLDAEFREVLVLHELEGLAYREIAAVVGIPIGTVMSRLARARQKLQRELAELMANQTSDGL